MSKAKPQSMFENLKKEKTYQYDVGEDETLDITYNELTLGRLSDLDMDDSDPESKYDIILKSIEQNHPDETRESIKEIPLWLAEQMIKDIFEFNGIDLPDELA